MDAKLNPSKNGYFLLNEYGDPYFLLIFLLRTASSWSSKKFSKNLWRLFWQFHKIVRKELSTHKDIQIHFSSLHVK